MSQLPCKTYAFDQHAQRLHPSPERCPAREAISCTIEVASSTSYGSRNFADGTVVSQFEIAALLFLYGPRFVGASFSSYCSTSPTISSMLHSVCVTPAAIAGDILSVL